MAQIDIQCDECQKIIKASIGQYSSNLELFWSLSYRCPYCTCTIEMDDAGYPPQEIRKQIFKQHGEWELKIDLANLKNKAKVLKALREVFSLSLLETSKIVKQSSYITRGTKVEIHWNERRLLNKDFISLIKKIY